MKTYSKRVLSVLLAVIMVFSVFAVIPFTASAEAKPTDRIDEITTLISSVKANSYANSGNDSGPESVFTSDTKFWHQNYGSGYGVTTRGATVWMQIKFRAPVHLTDIWFASRNDSNSSNNNNGSITEATVYVSNSVEEPDVNTAVSENDGIWTKVGDTATYDVGATTNGVLLKVNEAEGKAYTYLRFAVKATTYVTLRGMALYGTSDATAAAFGELQAKIEEVKALNVGDYLNFSKVQELLTTYETYTVDGTSLANLEAAVAALQEAVNALIPKYVQVTVKEETPKSNSWGTNPGSENEGQAEKAFDGDLRTFWMSNYGSATTDNVFGDPSVNNPVWVQFGFDAAQKIAKIEQTCRADDNSSTFKTFSLWCYNGDDEAALNSNAAEMETNGWTKLQDYTKDTAAKTQTAIVDNPVAAKYYRIVVTDVWPRNNDNVRRVNAAEITVYTENKLISEGTLGVVPTSDVNLVQITDYATLQEHASAGAARSESEGSNNDGPAKFAFDGNLNNRWHVPYNYLDSSNGGNGMQNPFPDDGSKTTYVQTGFGTSKEIGAITLFPRDNNYTVISDYEIWVSDTAEFTVHEVAAKGNFKTDPQFAGLETKDSRTVEFRKFYNCQYIRLVVKGTFCSNTQMSNYLPNIPEIYIYEKGAVEDALESDVRTTVEVLDTTNANAPVAVLSAEKMAGDDIATALAKLNNIATNYTVDMEKLYNGKLYITSAPAQYTLTVNNAGSTVHTETQNYNVPFCYNNDGVAADWFEDDAVILSNTAKFNLRATHNMNVTAFTATISDPNVYVGKPVMSIDYINNLNVLEVPVTVNNASSATAFGIVLAKNNASEEDIKEAIGGTANANVKVLPASVTLNNKGRYLHRVKFTEFNSEVKLYGYVVVNNVATLCPKPQTIATTPAVQSV